MWHLPQKYGKLLALEKKKEKYFVNAILYSMALLVLVADVSDYCQNFIISDNVLMQ